MGSLAQNSSGAIRCSGNTRFRRRFRRVPEGSGADGWWSSGGLWRRKLMKFRRVLVQMADEIPEGSGADGWWSSGGFQCRWLMKFQRVPVQMADEVSNGVVQTRFWRVPDGWWGSEGSGADSKQGLWRVRWLNGRKQTSFRTVLVQIAGEVAEGSGSAGGEVPDGS